MLGVLGGMLISPPLSLGENDAEISHVLASETDHTTTPFCLLVLPIFSSVRERDASG